MFFYDALSSNVMYCIKVCLSQCIRKRTYFFRHSKILRNFFSCVCIHWIIDDKWNKWIRIFILLFFFFSKTILAYIHVAIRVFDYLVRFSSFSILSSAVSRTFWIYAHAPREKSSLFYSIEKNRMNGKLQFFYQNWIKNE